VHVGVNSVPAQSPFRLLDRLVCFRRLGDHPGFFCRRLLLGQDRAVVPLRQGGFLSTHRVNPVSEGLGLSLLVSQWVG
jgi:hypothetical protein